jgi:ribosome maturation factor RimP
MAQRDVVTTVQQLATPVVTAMGLELVDVEYSRDGRTMILRLYVDKPGGVTLDDCAAVSREISPLLDVEDLVKGNYSLEVSSPGLNRPLRREGDFTRFAGRLVKVRTFELLPDDQGNPRKTFLGILKGVEGEEVIIDLKEGQGARIPLAAIDKAHLEFEF